MVTSIIKIRPISGQRSEYESIKNEVFSSIPEPTHLNIFSIKREFQWLIKSKRRFERIQSVKELVKVIEFDLN